MWVREGKEGILVAVEPMDMPASQEAEDGLASAITDRADMPIRDGRKVGTGLVGREIIRRCEDGRCGRCGGPPQARSLGVPLCLKCKAGVPGTAMGGDMEGLLLLFWTVADLRGRAAARLLVSTREAWDRWQLQGDKWPGRVRVLSLIHI